MLDKIGYRGLSVGSGNAYKLHFLRRTAVYVGAHNRIRRSRIRHEHLLFNSGIPLRHNPRSAAALCGTGVFVTVACSAFYAYKDGTRLDLP